MGSLMPVRRRIGMGSMKWHAHAHTLSLGGCHSDMPFMRGRG